MPKLGRYSTVAYPRATPAARVALEELVAYLSDQIPPLFFAESVQDLFGVPPQVVAAQIVAWSSSMP
jgi:hypothetical protein